MSTAKSITKVVGMTPANTVPQTIFGKEDEDLVQMGISKQA
jgi:hypothetical protein